MKLQSNAVIEKKGKLGGGGEGREKEWVHRVGPLINIHKSYGHLWGELALLLEANKGFRFWFCITVSHLNIPYICFHFAVLLVGTEVEHGQQLNKKRN